LTAVGTLQTFPPSSVVQFHTYPSAPFFRSATGTARIAGNDDGLSVQVSITVIQGGYPSCAHLRTVGKTASRVYLIDPGYPDPPGGRDDAFFAHCEMSAAGGGWTLAARMLGAKPTTVIAGVWEYGAFEVWGQYNASLNPYQPGLSPSWARLDTFDNVPVSELLIGVSPVNDPTALRRLRGRIADAPYSSLSLVFEPVDGATAPIHTAFTTYTGVSGDPPTEQLQAWRRLFWLPQDGNELRFDPATSPNPPFPATDCTPMLNGGIESTTSTLRVRIGVTGDSTQGTCDPKDAFLGLGGATNAMNELVYTGAVDASTATLYASGVFAALWVRDDDFTDLPVQEDCSDHEALYALDGWYTTIDDTTRLETPEYCDFAVDPPLNVCRDGIVEAPEACDDGNATNGDGCDNNCTLTGCGNGIVTGTEQCEPPNTPTCDSACRVIGGGG